VAAPFEKTAMLSIEEMYRAYGTRVFNQAYRIMGDRAAAEDVVHEVFIRIIQGAGSFRGESSVYAWVVAITRNLCLRSRKRTFRGLQKLMESGRQQPAQPAVTDEMEKRFYVGQVKDGCLTGLLRCLSFHQRVAFILEVLFRVPVGTVATVMGKSENSVRILVSRARANLKEFLCRNCSLYDNGNRCRCENMVQFSLRNALIPPYDPRTSPAAIESELKAFKDEVLLYQSLREQDPPVGLPQRLLSRKDLVILSRQKVK